MPVEVIQVDPKTLRIPPGRPDGADPRKLQLQISRFGRSLSGMPPILAYRAMDDELIIYNGVTRATRAAKLCPEQTGDRGSCGKRSPQRGDVPDDWRQIAMIDPIRERILQHLARFAEIDPEMRFGQLVSWIAAMARPDDPQATPNVDDDEFLRACEEHLENMERFAARRDSQLEVSSLTTHA